MKIIAPRALVVLLAFAVGAAAEDSPTFEVGGVKFDRPKGWESVEVTSPMRKAQLRVKSASGDKSADITFFFFGSDQGGGVEDNIRRWISQFQGGKEEIDPNVETREVSGTKVTLVKYEGTYNSGMPGGPTKPMPGYALHGAIIAGKKGDVFVKMTGPVEVVREAGKAFEEMITAAAATARPPG